MRMLWLPQETQIKTEEQRNGGCPLTEDIAYTIVAYAHAVFPF